MNYYGTNITFYISKQAGKIDNVNTPAISYRQGFSTPNVSMQMLVESIDFTAVCVE